MFQFIYLARPLFGSPVDLQQRLEPALTWPSQTDRSTTTTTDDEASCRRRSSLPVRYVWSGTSSELQHKHHPLPPSTELQLGAAPIQPTGRRANMHVCDYHRNSGKYLTFFFLHKNIQHLFFPLFLYSGANMQPAHQSVQETPLRSVILICEIYDCLEKINII